MSSSSPSTVIASCRGLKLLVALGLTLALSACDYVASFSKPKQTPEEAKAEGVALGAGCRQAGQSLEDCYQRNPDSLKAGIFAGWKDMHEYMAAKNIQTVTPLPAPEKTEAEAPKDNTAGKELSAEERAAVRRERREREKAAASKSKGGDSDSQSSRKNRDDGSSKN